MNNPQTIPVTLVTGPLGSGKTTLLRHLLYQADQPVALIINEFGDVAIDRRVVEGKNVRLAELGGGCVCCDLRGEFEDAIQELLTLVTVERLLVETTGVAEPDSLIASIQDELAGVRLEGVVTVVDADGLLQYAGWGSTLRAQIEAADLILLNKSDLVTPSDMHHLESRIQSLNSEAPVATTRNCRVDSQLIFSLTHQDKVKKPVQSHLHQSDVEAFSYYPESSLDRECFENFLGDIDLNIYRIKGFIRLDEGPYLFNWTRGRWDLEESKETSHVLVFIARVGALDRDWIVSRLKNCEETAKGSQVEH